MASKPAWQSKTLWINLICAVSVLFIPSINAWIQTHADMVAMGFTVINMGLRLITKGKIELLDTPPSA